MTSRVLGATPWLSASPRTIHPQAPRRATPAGFLLCIAHGLANEPSGAHSQAMILLKILDFLVAICVASMIALMLGFVAHYVFGLSRLDIRASALTGAAIFALLVATEWFAQLRKSK